MWAWRGREGAAVPRLKVYCPRGGSEDLRTVLFTRPAFLTPTTATWLCLALGRNYLVLCTPCSHPQNHCLLFRSFPGPAMSASLFPYLFIFPFSAPIRIILYICLFYRAETSVRSPVVIKEASESLFSGNSYSSCCFDCPENVFFFSWGLVTLCRLVLNSWP